MRFAEFQRGQTMARVKAAFMPRETQMNKFYR